MLTKKQHEELIAGIRDEIQLSVNGKIVALDKKMTERLDAQDKAIAPVIEAFAGGGFIFKVFIQILKILALLVPAGAGILLIKGYFHK